MAGVRRRGVQGGQRQLVLAPQLFAPRPDAHTPHAAADNAAHDAAAAVVGAYAFSATLAIQDITGMATSGVTASHIAKRLEPSAESTAYLFALTDARAPRPVTDLGYPELFAADLEHVQAWVFVSLPLLEDLTVIEANITLDAAIAPLPGEPVPDEPWRAALSLVDALSTQLERPTRHIWVTHAPGEFTPPTAEEFGYAPAFREDQATFPVEHISALPAPAGDIQVVEGPGFRTNRTGAPGEAQQFGRLLTAASRDYPRGDLRLDTIEWDLQRITDAGARLTDRGGLQLTGIVRAAGEIAGLCEVVRYLSDDPKVCELGLVYVLPEHRGRGLGAGLIRATLEHARDVWEDLETAYCSYPAGSAAAGSIMRALSAEPASATTAWQKLEETD